MLSNCSPLSEYSRSWSFSFISPSTSSTGNATSSLCVSMPVPVSELCMASSVCDLPVRNKLTCGLGLGHLSYPLIPQLRVCILDSCHKPHSNTQWHNDGKETGLPIPWYEILPHKHWTLAPCSWHEQTSELTFSPGHDIPSPFDLSPSQMPMSGRALQMCSRWAAVFLLHSWLYNQVMSFVLTALVISFTSWLLLIQFIKSGHHVHHISWHLFWSPIHWWVEPRHPMTSEQALSSCIWVYLPCFSSRTFLACIYDTARSVPLTSKIRFYMLDSQALMDALV